LVRGVGSTNPVDNQRISIRFEIGGDRVPFQARNPTQEHYYRPGRRPDDIDLYALTLDDAAGIAPECHVHSAEQLPLGRGVGRSATISRVNPKRPAPAQRIETARLTIGFPQGLSRFTTWSIRMPAVAMGMIKWSQE
jgi:hypothetical protein